MIVNALAHNDSVRQAALPDFLLPRLHLSYDAFSTLSSELCSSWDLLWRCHATEFRVYVLFDFDDLLDNLLALFILTFIFRSPRLPLSIDVKVGPFLAKGKTLGLCSVPLLFESFRDPHGVFLCVSRAGEVLCHVHHVPGHLDGPEENVFIALG